MILKSPRGREDGPWEVILYQNPPHSTTHLNLYFFSDSLLLLFQSPKRPPQCSLLFQFCDTYGLEGWSYHTPSHSYILCYIWELTQEELPRQLWIFYRGPIWGIGPVGTILQPLIYWWLSVSIQSQRMQYPYLLMRPIVVRLDMIKVGGRLECIIVPV